VWRVVLSGNATLTEIETMWSIDDLGDANEALDIQAEIEAAISEALQSK
jgi:hypothetical protein